MFDLLDERVYYERPIALRNPVVFYEGHLPAFAINTLIRKALGLPGIDAHLETIFARGIDPDTEAAAVARGNPAWPSREVVRAYAAEADRVIAEAIASAELVDSANPLLDGAQALWAILEHEDMHQETLAYMWHELPYAAKRKPDGYMTATPASLTTLGRSRVRIPAGTVTLGSPLDEGFAWDNERPSHSVRVEAFDIDVHKVTNAQFLEFVETTGHSSPHFWERDGDRWYWRGMFERIPLPSSWPVYVTWADAQAYARWRGWRLPTEAEFQRAAYGTPEGVERRYPWGDMIGDPPENFDFRRWDPEDVDAHPNGVSAFGVHGLVGNGWEWTATPFGPFDGFVPLPSYPEYSADFFDGNHFVMKGASPVTARSLVRPGFRNWFRSQYPYVYATFRCVGSA